MKKRIFSLMVAFLLVIGSTNAFAATAWLQDAESNTDGLVETEVVASATNGSVELVSGNATTDPDPLNYNSPVEFKFTANPGYMLGSKDDDLFGANNPLEEEYYFSAEMRAVWPGSGSVEKVLPNLDEYYDLESVIVDTDNYSFVTISVDVVRNGTPFPEGVVFAHLEPELSAAVSVTFVEEEVETYSVTAASIPSGVATFTGTGSGFESGDPFDVNFSITNSNYEFVEWVTEHSGNIVEGDVHVIARFREKTTPPVFYYTVSAVSNPAGVATFTGTGGGFIFGSAYDVQYTQIVEGYEFTGWSAANSGTISGNVNLVANFEPIAAPTFDVTAVSQPAGVATFAGTLAEAEDGTAYSVSVATVEEGFEFVEWLVAPSGTIDGADVQVIAVFEEVEETILDEEVAEDIPDEELPEAGGIPTMAFSGLGLVVAAIGKKLRK